MSRYGSTFYEHVTRTALDSARIVLPRVRDLLPVCSVVDFGCGEGAWLSVWRELGVEQTLGVDASSVDVERLLLPRATFVAGDLTHPVDLGRRFDLVQSLEVGEHLPATAAEVYVDTLVRHGPVVLFSAAVRGQGGHDHKNERSYEYWRARFRRHRFVPLDPFRRRLVADRRVSPWYRYNILLYVDEAWLAEHPALAHHRVPDDLRIGDVAPPLYRLRRRVLRRLPRWLVTRLAQVKELRTVVRGRLSDR